MKLSGASGHHLTYCLNVHPGERLDEVRRAVVETAVELKGRLAPDRELGLGLRLGAEAAAALDDPEACASFRSLLGEHRLYAFTVNAFPYGRFHGTRVKEQVYAPDWQTEERLAYTLRAARCLARLLPDELDGSISTVPVGFGASLRDPAARERAVRNLCRCAAELAKLERETGRYLHLGLEPEPACYLETSGDVVTFYEEALLAGASGMGLPEHLVRRHVGVCLDTCHLALQFEDSARSLRDIEARGILVSKIQVSAALAAPCTGPALEALQAFDEPTYLHQVVVRRPGGALERWTDLPEALAGLREAPAAEVRVHFHVPLFWEGDGLLGTTAAGLDDRFRRALDARPGRHLEIETYTFDVLPGPLREARLVDSLAREFTWVFDRGLVCA